MALEDMPSIEAPVNEKIVGQWGLRDSVPGAWIYPIYLAAASRRISGLSMRVLMEHLARSTMNSEAITAERKG